MAGRDEAARETILRHHSQLVEGVRVRVAELADAVVAGESHQLALTKLVAYVAGEVLPHAVAEEETLYPAAASVGLGSQVDGMITEHRQLEHAVEALACTIDAAEALTQARVLEATFTEHVTTENDVVLPALLRGGASLADVLLPAMHERFLAAKQAGVRRGRVRADQRP